MPTFARHLRPDPRRRLPGVALALCLLIAAAAPALPLHPEAPGVLSVRLQGADREIESRTASDGAEVWAWSWGVLRLAPDAPPAELVDDVLRIPYEATLEGHTAEGRVRFGEPRTHLEGQVLMRDGGLTLSLASGLVLETVEDGLLLRRNPLSGDARTGLIMFLGMMLVTGLLLWNSRRRLGRS